jgi:hypothetical protein
MPAFATIAVSDIPLTRSAVSVGVYRYQPLGGYEFLQNVRILGIRYQEGPDAGIARFRYVFDYANAPTDPSSFQEAMSVDSDLSGVVRNDDRIVVFLTNPDGTNCVLFDGFAQVPELNLSPYQEMVTFLAFGVAVREWDTPIGGALCRNADHPTTVSDVETDLLTRFNPQGEPNATPEGADATDTFGNTYPTFLDQLVIRNPDVRRLWTLPLAVRYLCYHHNPSQTYVRNPDGSLIDALLDSRAPSGGVTLIPDDPSTYTSEPIIVPDFPATGKAWPVALHELLESNGFGMVFRLDTDANGNPYTYLDLFRKRDGTPSTLKELFLQLAGEPLDPAQSNLGSARLARDTTGIANIITVDTQLVRYEASFILAPGFPISASDAASTSTLGVFNKNDPSFSQTNRDKYRLYVFDETGEGHWDFTKASFVTTLSSLAPLLGGNSANQNDYVNRRRIPMAELISTDANRKPLKARLAISTNYAGSQPGLWDGTGTWQTVLGGFELLSDRLGVWINVSNPNSWNIGVPSQGVGLPYPAGVVKGVEDQALSGGGPLDSWWNLCTEERKW